MINKQILLSLVSLLLGLSAFGQISEGGVPPSFSYNRNLLKSAGSITNIPVNLDITRLAWEDDIVERNGGPVRVAEVLPVDVNISRTGSWTTFPDSVKIWQQTIYAEGARGLIISYKDFYIPEGAKLFIYNADHSQILGAYTKDTHPGGGPFATEIIFGDKVTLEYVASTISEESPRIVLEDVGYIYSTRQNEAYVPTPPINQSAPCMINVNCAAGANWQKQKRGVVLLYIKVNVNWIGCSGSLVNNTKRDGTPYILTASHCFEQYGTIDYDQLVVYFNYEFPGCRNGSIFPATSRTLVGVNLLVQAPIEDQTVNPPVRGSDGALIKLKNNVPLDWKPFYNGWDRRNVPATSGVVIHHPYYDVKKITTFEKPIITTTFDGTDANRHPITGAPNASWLVTYDGNSVTQEGSSGSPLFSQEGLIVGTLSGGQSLCTDPLYPDIFGKFSYHWDYLPGANKQLKTYLDPINENTKTLKGYDPNYPTGIEDDVVDTTPKEIVIFPTIADNEVNINVGSIIRNVKVYDMAGRQIYARSDYNASTTTISVDGWQKGVYSIVVQTDTQRLTDKFIKK